MANQGVAGTEGFCYFLRCCCILCARFRLGSGALGLSRGGADETFAISLVCYWLRSGLLGQSSRGTGWEVFVCYGDIDWARKRLANQGVAGLGGSLRFISFPFCAGGCFLGVLGQSTSIGALRASEEKKWQELFKAEA